MKILIAYDGSTPAQHMLGQLIERLGWFRDPPQLTLLYVHPALPHGRAVAWAGKEAVENYYREESETCLASGRTLLDARDVRHEVQREVGDPSTEILNTAQRGGFDLIAMGRHGAGGLVTMVLGSVASKVLARSDIPVLLLGHASQA